MLPPKKSPDWRSPLIGLLGLAMLSVAPVHGGNRLAINRAQMHSEAGRDYLSAQVEFEFDPEVVHALNSGVELTLLWECRLVPAGLLGHVWPTARRTWRSRIRYHALAQRYFFTDELNRRRHSFASLPRVLDELGRLDAVPVWATPDRAAQAAHSVSLALSLDRERLPLPLRLESYLAKPWAEARTVYQWPYGSSGN